MRAYPAPAIQRWAVMVQLRSGEQVVGTDDRDVLDRWRRLQWAAPSMDAATFKERILGYARVLYGAGLIGLDGETPDEQFLDALTAEGVLQVIRKL